MDTSMPFISGDFFTKPFQLLEVDNHTELGDQSITHVGVPDFRSVFKPDNVILLICYAMLWFTVNVVVNAYCWKPWKDAFRRRRLINLTTSLTHSVVIGSIVTFYFFRNTRLMFASPFHYYGYLELQIILSSLGYFVYDAIDMFMSDIMNVGCAVLMFHHLATMYFMLVVVASHKYLLYAYWCLMMEKMTPIFTRVIFGLLLQNLFIRSRVQLILYNLLYSEKKKVSSVFLHCRSILNQSKLSTTSMIGFYRVISCINIAAFVPFRFLIQAFLIAWTFVNIHNLHWFYSSISLVCMASYLFTNTASFIRLLLNDGFLGSKFSKGQLGVFAEDNGYDKVESEESFDFKESSPQSNE